MLMMPTSNEIDETTPYLSYRLREDRIHELVYRQSSHEAVDAFFNYINRWATDGTPDDLYCILNDLRESGHQPLNYYFKRLLEANSSHPINERPQARVALLYNNSPLVGIVNAFVRSLNPTGVHIRIFNSADYDEAVRWLLSEREQFINERL